MREMTRGFASLLGICLLANCSRTAPEPPARPKAPPALFSDGAHGGLPHFYLLPPIVPAPSYSGTFDATLAPVVTACPLAGGGCIDVAARVDATGQIYIANW